MRGRQPRESGAAISEQELSFRPTDVHQSLRIFGAWCQGQRVKLYGGSEQKTDRNGYATRVVEGGSNVAGQVSGDYEENADLVKYFLATGEIDIVVGGALTDQPFDAQSYAGLDINVEACAEVIATKVWHRRNQSKVRELFDLCRRSRRRPRSH